MKTVKFEGKERKVFTIHVFDEDVDIILVGRTYNTNGTLAVEALVVENGRVSERWCVCTTNLDPYTGFGVQSEKRAYLNLSDGNEEWLPQLLADNGIAVPLEHSARSGFCTYPLYEWDLTKACA